MNGFRGLLAGASFANPTATIPVNWLSVLIKSTSSLYAKHVFAIHNVPNPCYVAVNIMFSIAAPMDSESQISTMRFSFSIPSNGVF